MSRNRLVSRSAALTAVLILASACGTDAPTAVTAPPTSEGTVAAPHYITVMTRNLLLGTDIGIVLSAPPQQVPLAVGQAYALVPASKPQERMIQIADEIIRMNPDVVGLQEAVKWMVQRPGDFLAGNPEQASTVEYDLIQLLLDALHARGVDYDVASLIENTDIELPGLPPNTQPLPQNFIDVRLVDRDAVIVRRGVLFSNPQAANFDAGLPLQIGPVSKKFLRGWASVDVSMYGQSVRFITAHLETQSAPPVQVAQASELLAIAQRSTLPVIMAGDFNSAANASAPANEKTATYGMFIDAGFEDAWTIARPGDEGLTCCHDPSLTSSTVNFNQRLDLVVFRGLVGAGSANITGKEISDRTPFGRWPSDHAGLAISLRLP